MGRIVLYPSPGMGHLISMVELGKFILTHHPSFTITILIVPPSFNTGSTASYIRNISASEPSITFHHLPSVPLDLHLYPSMEAIIFETLRRSNDEVRRALETMIPDISALIIDFFCTPVLSVSAELKIPTYYFFTSGACALALAFYLVTLDRKMTKSYKDMGNTLLDVPGLPPIPASDMWKPILDMTADKDFLDWSSNLPNSAGILVNTFESLEPSALGAIRAGKCNPDTITPPVFCVGPLLSGASASAPAEHGCLKWLDEQPKKSVIFLCFGSLGLLSAKQLHELAIGLERSGRRFLWVVRSPPSEDKSNEFLPPPEPDLDLLLPEGFLERTKDIGMVLKSWAPQVAVLNHESIGGFVTHCGWNSTLEAICAGVPMVAWPLYAEQHFNRVVMVEEMKLALRITEAEDGLVKANEVEDRMNELMDSSSEKGEEVRKQVKEMSLAAKAAMSEGGSSIAALAQLAELWKHGQS